MFEGLYNKMELKRMDIRRAVTAETKKILKVQCSRRLSSWLWYRKTDSVREVQ